MRMEMMYMKLRLTGGDKPLYDTNAKVGLSGWIMQEVGKLVLHTICTAVFLLSAYITIAASIVTKLHIMIVMAVFSCAGVLMGIASIIIGMCNIIYLIRELRSDKHKY